MVVYLFLSANVTNVQGDRGMVHGIDGVVHVVAEHIQLYMIPGIDGVVVCSRRASCIWSKDYMYNVYCSLYLVHGSDPLSLRRASSPVHIACLVVDQDLFLKTKRKQIKNICRG